MSKYVSRYLLVVPGTVQLYRINTALKKIKVAKGEQQQNPLPTPTKKNVHNNYYFATTTTTTNHNNLTRKGSKRNIYTQEKKPAYESKTTKNEIREREVFNNTTVRSPSYKLNGTLDIQYDVSYHIPNYYNKKKRIDHLDINCLLLFVHYVVVWRRQLDCSSHKRVESFLRLDFVFNAAAS